MWVITVKKIKVKFLLTSIFLLVLIFSAIGYKVFEFNEQAKVNRSNAMQVTKPLEQIFPVAMPDFFTEYRLERDKLRSERAEILRESIKSAKTDEARQTAHVAILRTIQEKQQETEMENLIKARGFADTLVFIRDNTVNAVIKTQSLSKDDVIQVADIISKVSGVKTEDITISAKQ